MQFDISFERNEIYECGAELLSVLACPEQSDEAKRFQLCVSLCGKAIWLKYMLAQDDWTPVPVRLQYVFRDSKDINRDVNFVVRRMGERMVAGRMAVPFFQRSKLGRVAALPEEIKRLSVNQMTEYVLEDAGQADSENVKKRVWRPTQPVIHIAAAAAIVGQQLRNSGQVLALESFLFQRVLIEFVVRQAEELGELIAKDAQFPVKAEKLVRVRLA
jgi:hypothetical protein